jgi:hypothetical protein
MQTGEKTRIQQNPTPIAKGASEQTEHPKKGGYPFPNGFGSLAPLLVWTAKGEIC